MANAIYTTELVTRREPRITLVLTENEAIAVTGVLGHCTGSKIYSTSGVFGVLSDLLGEHKYMPAYKNITSGLIDARE